MGCRCCQRYHYYHHVSRQCASIHLRCSEVTKGAQDWSRIPLLWRWPVSSRNWRHWWNNIPTMSRRPHHVTWFEWQDETRIGCHFFQNPYFVTVSRTSGNVYVSDYESRSVTCVSPSGNIIFTYTHPSLIRPLAILLDDLDNMGRDVRKPVFGDSNKVRLKPACSATETSWKVEISLMASLDCDTFQKAKNKGADQTARVRRLVCAYVFRNPPKTGFLASRPIW